MRSIVRKHCLVAKLNMIVFDFPVKQNLTIHKVEKKESIFIIKKKVEKHRDKLKKKERKEK